MTQGNIDGRRDSELLELGPDDRQAYADWLRRNPTGFVMILDGSVARLHESHCAAVQIKDTGKRRMHKVVGRPVKALREWAGAHGRRFVQCRRCR